MLKFPGMAQADPRSVSPLVLAYIGDCVFDLIIKLMVAERETGRCISCTRRQAVMCRLHPVVYDAFHAGTSDRAGARGIPQRPKCQKCYSGQKSVDYRLPKGDRV